MFTTLHSGNDMCAYTSSRGHGVKSFTSERKRAVLKGLTFKCLTTLWSSASLKRKSRFSTAAWSALQIKQKHFCDLLYPYIALRFVKRKWTKGGFLKGKLYAVLIENLNLNVSKFFKHLSSFFFHDYFKITTYNNVLSFFQY